MDPYQAWLRAWKAGNAPHREHPDDYRELRAAGGRRGELKLSFQEHPEGIASSPLFNPTMMSLSILMWMGGMDSLIDWINKYKPWDRGMCDIKVGVMRTEFGEKAGKFDPVGVFLAFNTDVSFRVGRLGWPEMVPADAFKVIYADGCYVPAIKPSGEEEFVKATYEDLERYALDNLVRAYDAFKGDTYDGLVLAIAEHLKLPMPGLAERPFRDSAWDRREAALLARR